MDNGVEGLQGMFGTEHTSCLGQLQQAELCRVLERDLRAVGEVFVQHFE